MERAFVDRRLMLGRRAESAEACLAFGVDAAISNLNGEAEQAFRKALSLKPDYHWARYCLGVVLTDTGRPAEAIAELEAAASGLQGNLRVARALGRAWIMLGDGARAAAVFECALADGAEGPEAGLLRQELAGAYYADGRFAEASRQMERALEARPRAADLRVNLGVSYIAEGKTERAAAQFMEALKINPQMVSALRNLGTLRFKAGEIDQAIALLEKAASIDASHPSTLRKLAFAYKEKGDQARAELSMTRAMEIEASQ